MSRPLTVGREMLVRDRLLDRIAARWAVPITVIFAPAGYGKTTLLRHAVAANAARPVGVDLWLTCTPRCTALSSFGEALCRAVEAPQPSLSRPNVDMDDLVASVVEAVWRRAPQEVALLVDDVHELPPGSDAARLLQMVVASLPANGHVVLVGRSAPPFPLARREVEGQVVRLDQADLAFTPAELGTFAALRGVSVIAVQATGGWPALAELSTSARAGVTRDYVGQEVVAGLKPEKRRAIALLCHLDRFDEEVAAAVVGPEVDVAELLGDLPLVEVSDGPDAGEDWFLHPLWRSFLGGEVTSDDVADARRRTAGVLRRRGQPGAAIPLLIEAEAWGDLAGAIVDALSAAHPPVARDLLAEWFARLPAGARAEPSGRLLAAVAASERDPVEAGRQLEDCAAAFRSRGDLDGELTSLVQLGLLAWWTDDAAHLAALAARVMEMEAAGHERAAPFASLGRALLFDMTDDSGRMLTELDRIAPGVLNEPWQAIVVWLRSIALLQLGHAAEALADAAQAIARGGRVMAPLIESTRLQALWFLGRAGEAFEALPSVIERVEASGQRNHVAQATAQACVVHAVHGRVDEARRLLARARAAGAAGAAGTEASLVATMLAVAEATMAIAAGDEAGAAALLAAYVERHPIGVGTSAPVQRRYLPFFYVLLPETRPAFDRMDLGPAWRTGRDLARALVDVRDERRARSGVPPAVLDDPAVVQALLPPAWVAELALAAVAAGQANGSRLLDATWSAVRPAVEDVARNGRGGRGGLRTAARATLVRLPAPPPAPLDLRLLGPVELRRDGTLVDDAEWRRERVRSLLTYLVLRRTASRAEVGDALWPTLDLDGQSRNLRVTLTYLLRVLEPGRSQRASSYLVRQHGNNVLLHPDGWLDVDLWDFDDLCERAAAADQRRAPAEFLDIALRAVDLWRGEPTDALAEPWAVPLLERRRVRFAATAVRAGELLLACGHTDRASDLAERVLATDPWHEPAYRLLVASNHAADDDLAVHRAVDRYRGVLDELGIDDREAAAMARRLLDNLRPRH